MVQNVLSAVQLHPGSVFIDGGCNLGLYTALVAAMGAKVLAIDGMADNIALLRWVSTAHLSYPVVCGIFRGALQ